MSNNAGQTDLYYAFKALGHLPLSGSTLNVAFALISHFNVNTKQLNPGIRGMARRLMLSKNTVNSAINEMENLGIITNTEARLGARARYDVNWSRLREIVSEAETLQKGNKEPESSSILYRNSRRNTTAKFPDPKSESVPEDCDTSEPETVPADCDRSEPEIDESVPISPTELSQSSEQKCPNRLRHNSSKELVEGTQGSAREAADQTASGAARAAEPSPDSSLPSSGKSENPERNSPAGSLAPLRSADARSLVQPMSDEAKTGLEEERRKRDALLDAAEKQRRDGVTRAGAESALMRHLRSHDPGLFQRWMAQRLAPLWQAAVDAEVRKEGSGVPILLNGEAKPP